MKRIKAEIEDDEGRSTMEFSVEEVMGHSPGIAWGEMDENGRLHVLEDYALWLHGRQDGKGGRPRVNIDPASVRQA